MYCRRFASRFIAVILMYFALPIFTASDGLTVEPAIQRGPEGNDFTFECVGERPLVWYKMLPDGTEMEVHNNHRFDIIYRYVPELHHHLGRMTVRQATVAESGNYVCKGAGLRLSESVELRVFTVAAYRNELPMRTDHEASVEINPSMPELAENEDLILSCTFENASAGSLAWSVNKGAETESLTDGEDETSHIQVLDNGTLIIRKMTNEDAGVYTCTHSDEEGSQSAEVNLGGRIKLTAPQSVKFTEGTDARMKCKARVTTAVFLPDIEWLVNGEDVGSACVNRCSIEKESTNDTITSWLNVAEITKEDRKNYSCIASNGASEEREDILLRVRDRLAALWPFLGILLEVLIIVIVLVIHEKCKGNDFGEEEEEDLKKEVKPNMGDSDLRMRTTKQ